MKELKNLNQPTKDENEIDLLMVAKTVWSYKMKIFMIIGAFVVAGAIFAKLSEKEFTASSTFIPQTSENRGMGGNLGGLASLAGINIGDVSSAREIPPALYPTIISSVRFKKALIAAQINPEGLNEPVTYADYYENFYNPGPLHYLRKFTIGLPAVIIDFLFGGSNKIDDNEPKSTSADTSIMKLTQEEVNHFSRLAKQIRVQPSDKQQVIELSFIMPEPLMAAQMARYAESLLQQELIDYKIQSAREQLNFTEQRFIEKKNEFETIQNRLAVFRDRNQNITSAIAMNQLDRMEAEYNFSFNIYTELAKQLEQAKLQVSKDTPIFMIIEPVTIPTGRSAPKFFFIVLIFFVFGTIISICYVFGKEVIAGMRGRWND